MKYRPLSSIVIDSGSMKIYRGDQCVRVPKSQFAIFRLLWRRRSAEPFSIQRIEHELYALRPNCDWPAPKDCVCTMICRLRAAIAPLGVSLGSVWGEGYFLELSEHEERRMAA